MRKNQCKVITGPETLWSYVNVWEPRAFEGGEPRYSVSLIIAKQDTETLRLVAAAIKAAYEQGASRLRDSNGEVPALGAIRSPLHDGDTERPEDPAYHDSYYLNANSPTPPGIVDGACRPITDQSQVYSGVRGRASITFYAYNRGNNRGIACGLNNLQKLEDGELLGKISAADEFGTVCDEFAL